MSQTSEFLAIIKRIFPPDVYERIVERASIRAAEIKKLNLSEQDLLDEIEKGFVKIENMLDNLEEKT